ncbi:MAG TPA: cell division protein ZapD [Gammaproteobacteria bacterium]|nr:cell division protein ZapD [Gammaproteobacteria bacterium]
MIENTIIYEQPLNELIRVCLRLEQIFHQIDHQITDTSAFGTRNVIAAIMNILQLLDRPDLKAKLAKELSHHMAQLIRLENTPEIDQPKLRALLKQLEELARCFIDSNGKIGQHLREVELLNNLRLHLASPGGACSFDIPVYHYWLHRSAEERQGTLKVWLAEFNNIRKAAKLILQLVRESVKIQQKTAEHGFYQALLDPQTNLRLIRVAIPETIPAYPEISIGRHFLSVRFFSPAIKERPTQYLHHLQFWISHCAS